MMTNLRLGAGLNSNAACSAPLRERPMPFEWKENVALRDAAA
jgi:hypothetical protein